MSELFVLPYAETPIIEYEHHVLVTCPKYHFIRSVLNPSMKSLILVLDPNKPATRLGKGTPLIVLSTVTGGLVFKSNYYFFSECFDFSYEKAHRYCLFVPKSYELLSFF